ncbi:hypothetical protein IMZ31_23180 (plasmid) [Pontibacillus sp. ALD_SL1]|uniref:hypothetical protein n=1 Tax=Pontibacillus sp. ALD_SL1 TaxID=2777185 RepID=UPI001A95E652|nr:hypothetical protein [Pontibacillus sp. ALD_SL1]QST02357.1 hypothetical protein IMZ31_23180 [Pontibacillus sp. ALD_SL1]
MIDVYIGQNNCGKTDTIKRQLKHKEGRIVILDFGNGNKYDDLSDHHVYLDELNPTLSPLGLIDLKAMNAGYLRSSQCFYKKGEDILRECLHTLRKESPETEETIDSIRKDYLIEETIERLRASWDQNENIRGKKLHERIPMNKHKKHISLTDVLESINERPVTLLKAKNMYSEHLRAMTFLILSRLSRESVPCTVVSDEQSTIFNKGNIKLFMSSLGESMTFIMGSNKISTFPKPLLPYIDMCYLHRVDSASEIRALKNLDLVKSTNPSSLPKGSFTKIKIKELV